MKTDRYSVETIKANLARLESVIQGPDVRPADIETRDRLARLLRDVKASTKRRA